MANTQLENWIAENKELVAERVNAYMVECNIKLSEFSEGQKHRLAIGLCAREINKMTR